MTEEIDHEGQAHRMIDWVRQIAARDDVGVEWRPASQLFAGWVGRRILSMWPTKELCCKMWPDEIRRIVG